ncbi:hypothetical protein N9Y42_07565 [Mariniblastus sp.]|nr:hypothetical protein [Mariniblastus sp.]
MINCVAEILNSSALANHQFYSFVTDAGIIAGAAKITPFQLVVAIITAVILTFAIGILSELLPHSRPYVVYRHRPSNAFWPNEDLEQDHELILAVFERSTRGSASGHEAEEMIMTTRSGTETFLMHKDDIPNWVSEMNELLASGKLKYYTEFGFNKKGRGLESPSNLGDPVDGQLTSKPTAAQAAFSVART